MEKTLWELASTWQHEHPAGHGPMELLNRNCRRCQLEAWARAKAKEYAALDEPLILIDLGVPEENP